MSNERRHLVRPPFPRRHRLRWDTSTFRANYQTAHKKILRDYPKGLNNRNLKIIGGDFLRFVDQPSLPVL